jgi:hypothetical protein
VLFLKRKEKKESARREKKRREETLVGQTEKQAGIKNK